MSNLVQHVEAADNAWYPVLADPMELPPTGGEQGPVVEPAHQPQAEGSPMVLPPAPADDNPGLTGLMTAPFDDSSEPEPTFNPYNPLTYPEPEPAPAPEPAGDWTGLITGPVNGVPVDPDPGPEVDPYRPFASDPTYSPWTDLLDPSFSKEPLPQGQADRPAAGQDLTYPEWVASTIGNERLEGRVHEGSEPMAA